jgi:hypothetical protein
MPLTYVKKKIQRDIIRTMPMCATGKSLRDAWTEYADMVNLLATRETGGLFTHVMADVVVPLSREEAYQKGMAAQREFLLHLQVCPACDESAFR